MKNLFLFSLLLFLWPCVSKGQAIDTMRVRLKVDTLIQRCRDLLTTKQYDEAVQVIGKAETEASLVFGKMSALYGTCLHNHARVFYAKGDESLAETLYHEVLDIRGKTIGKNHPDYASSLYNLAQIYDNKNAFAAALPLFTEAKEIWKKFYGPEYAYYLRCLNSIAIIYRENGEYEKAALLFLEAKEIRERTLGAKHDDYLLSLQNLGNIYLEMGKYDNAEPLLTEIKNLIKELKGTENKGYSIALTSLGSLFYSKGDYIKAQACFQEAMDINRRIFGIESLEYANSQGNLGVIYYETGDYIKAEAAYLNVISIVEKKFGKESPHLSSTLLNIANLYSDIGDYAKSEKIHKRIIEIKEKNAESNTPSYAMALNNLASNYLRSGNYLGAEQLLLQAKSIWQSTLGNQHPDYLLAVSNLGDLYYATSKFSAADSLYKEVIATRKNILGADHPSYAIALGALAKLYLEEGKYDAAEPLYLEELSIEKKALGSDHPRYIGTVYNMSLLYTLQKKAALAKEYAINSIKGYRSLLEKNVLYCSESEILANINFYNDNFDVFYSLTQASPDPDLLNICYDNALTMNGFYLENGLKFATSLKRTDSLTLETYHQWIACQETLSQALTQPVPDKKEIDSIEVESERHEKLLRRALTAFGTARKNIHCRDVFNQLGKTEAAIEFIHYNYYSPEITDSTFYAALLLLPNDTTPQFIVLCEEQQLNNILARQEESTENYIQQLYSSPRTDRQASLYHLVWQPIDKILKENGIKTVYYTSSGLLHRLNLAAIGYGRSGNTVADSFHLVQLGSTRQLIDRTPGTALPTSALIYGGLQYSMDSVAIAHANLDLSATAQDTTGGLFQYAVYVPEDLKERGDDFRFLAGTDREAKYIFKLLQKRKVHATMRRGYFGTEESVKQIGLKEPSPGLIHFSTHGFFFTNPKDSLQKRQDTPVFKMSEHPLIRSGLLLSGSAYAWYKKRPMTGMEDGILTAHEVSQLNLSNTELVVLSACETGLGDIKGNEGVYGLQRAFRIAGAKNVLMSLWEVPDAATEKLMTRFYDNWLEKKQPLRAAFEDAQQWLRKQKGFESPYKWAGFVLLGE